VGGQSVSWQAVGWLLTWGPCLFLRLPARLPRFWRRVVGAAGFVFADVAVAALLVFADVAVVLLERRWLAKECWVEKMGYSPRSGFKRSIQASKWGEVVVKGIS
jgi:hypothetical protein